VVPAMRASNGAGAEIQASAMRGRGPGRETGLGRICFQALTLRALGMFDTVRRFEPDTSRRS
jgi:hypothetical protein